MTASRQATIVAVAFAWTAEVQAWEVAMTREEGEDVERTLRNLFDLGHVVGFSVRPMKEASFESLIADLGARLGALTVGACLGPGVPPLNLEPSFLMPVWAFDHVVGCAPASTARFLGLDLELIATLSPDEELGAYLPGRTGRWLIHARPLF